MLSAVDDGVGQILQLLHDNGQGDDTLIFYLSDNGGMKDTSSSNWPLRGYKSDLFEGGMHVPFAVQWNGTIPPGQDYSYPVSSLDIMATIAELANAEISPERPLDGVNLIPYLTDDTKKMGPPHPKMFWRKLEDKIMAAEGSDGLKVVSNHDLRGKDKAWTTHLLFDLETDLSENYNLMHNKQYSDAYQTLFEEWKEWNSTLMDHCIFPTLDKDKWWEKFVDAEEEVGDEAYAQGTGNIKRRRRQHARRRRRLHNQNKHSVEEVLVSSDGDLDIAD